jgi:hypothetical protein
MDSYLPLGVSLDRAFLTPCQRCCLEDDCPGQSVLDMRMNRAECNCSCSDKLYSRCCVDHSDCSKGEMEDCMCLACLERPARDYVCKGMRDEAGPDEELIKRNLCRCDCTDEKYRTVCLQSVEGTTLEDKHICGCPADGY